jgi:hypothetical protein
MLSDDIIWTLDDCDDADLSPESKRALGLSSDEQAPRIMLESGEVPAMNEEHARELLARSRVRAA